jgi:hypothetical protein
MSVARSGQKAAVLFNRIYVPGGDGGPSFRPLLREADEISNIGLGCFAFVGSSPGLKIPLRRMAGDGVA